MRLSLPTHVPLGPTVAIAAVIVVVQQCQHTNFAFSLMFFAFTVVSALTFNLAGGMSRPSGGYVFFFALLTVIVGVVVKALVGEPADSNLEMPLLTMAVYTCSILVMLPVVLLTNKLVGHPKGLFHVLGGNRINLRHAGIGCAVIGALIFCANLSIQQQNGTLLSALNQTNYFWPIAIVLITVNELQRSNGEKSVSFLSLVFIVFTLGLGMISFSKQGVLTPFVAWIMGALYGRMRVRWFHCVFFIALGVFSFTLLGPVTAIGRDLPPGNTTTRIQEVVALLSNFQQTRADYNSALAVADASNARHGYFSHSLGFGDRLTMLTMDDALISYTEQRGALGYAPVPMYFANWIPHVLLPHKNQNQTPYGGNYYAHELGGLLTPDDLTTGISVGAVGEAFRMDKWVGVLLLTPALWLLLFVTTDLMCGELRFSPWGLVAILMFAHVAPESGIGGIIYFIWFNNIAFLLAIVFSTYVAPIIGNLFGVNVHSEVSTRDAVRRQITLIS